MDAQEKIKRPSRFARVRGWYAKFEGPFSSISLIGGFVFDAVTLKRVDMFWENFWVVIHLLIVATAIILINITEHESPGTGTASASGKNANATNPEKVHFWLVNILQFFFGGILSTYLVFYFRSSSIWVSWPFLLLLAAAFVANERLKRHYTRLTFQISLLFLSFYAFAIYLIPVIVRQIGPLEFILSGIASIIAIGIFIYILRLLSSREKMKGSMKFLVLVIGGIFIGINVLYFYNFIPPIPLSLKDNGLYHSLTVNAPGNYTVTQEDQGLFSFFTLYPDIHLETNDPLYAYSAIFSPGSFKLTIIHEWQHYDTTTNTWVTRGRIPLNVSGGSDGGYRTYSEEEDLAAGKWRVNVLTSDGQVIGRITFNVVTTSTEPALQTVSID